MKWRALVLVSLSALLFLSTTLKVQSINLFSGSLAESQANFRVVLYPTQGLTFENNPEEYITLTPTTGIFHTLTGQIQINPGGGYFAFGAIADSTVNITYTCDGARVRGDQGNEQRTITSGTIITIENGNPVIIEWDITYEQYVPFMFILGMIGLVALMGSPLYGIYAVRKRERDSIVTALIMGCLGFGLFIAWLWGV